MRDGQILQRQQIDGRRIAMIYKQMVFIDTRMQAMESVFKNLTFWERLHLSPNEVIKRVDKLHLEILRLHDKQLKEVQETEKATSKLTIVGANGVSHG